MKKFGFEKLSLGCILGKVNLVDVKRYNSNEEFIEDKNLHLAGSDFGNFGFVLKSARRVKEIPCKGKLGFWEFDYSEGNN